MKFYIPGSPFFSIFNFVILRVLGAFVVQMLFLTERITRNNESKHGALRSTKILVSA